MLMQMIVETLLGALTGYVTNHTAIRRNRPEMTLPEKQAAYWRNRC